jgi:hypothetical protein
MKLVIIKNVMQLNEGARLDVVDQDTGETLYRIIIQKEGIFLNSGLFSQVCINHLVSDFPFDLLVAMVEVMVEWVKSSKQLQNNNLPWMTGN